MLTWKIRMQITETSYSDMQSLTRNQQPPTGKTAPTEFFEMMEAVEKCIPLSSLLLLLL